MEVDATCENHFSGAASSTATSARTEQLCATVVRTEQPELDDTFYMLKKRHQEHHTGLRRTHATHDDRAKLLKDFSATYNSVEQVWLKKVDGDAVIMALSSQLDKIYEIYNTVKFLL